MKTLSYDGLTETQQERVEGLVAYMEGCNQNNNHVISFVAGRGKECNSTVNEFIAGSNSFVSSGKLPSLANSDILA